MNMWCNQGSFWQQKQLLRTFFSPLDFCFPYGLLEIISPGNCWSGKSSCLNRHLQGQRLLRSPFHFCLVTSWLKVFSVRIILSLARKDTAMPIFASSAKVWKLLLTKTDHSLIWRFLSSHHRKTLNINLRLKSASQVLVLKKESLISNSKIQDNEKLREPSLLFSFLVSYKWKKEGWRS